MRANVDLETLMMRSFWSVAALPLLKALPAHAQEDFLPVEQAFRLTVRCA